MTRRSDWGTGARGAGLVLLANALVFAFFWLRRPEPPAPPVQAPASEPTPIQVAPEALAQARRLREGDADGSGDLTAGEIQTVLKRRVPGLSLDGPAVGAIVAAIDMDGDGHITSKEFIVAIQQVKNRMGLEKKGGREGRRSADVVGAEDVQGQGGGGREGAYEKMGR